MTCGVGGGSPCDAWMRHTMAFDGGRKGVGLLGLSSAGSSVLSLLE